MQAPVVPLRWAMAAAAAAGAPMSDTALAEGIGRIGCLGVGGSDQLSHRTGLGCYALGGMRG
jgi:hypothetical protein